MNNESIETPKIALTKAQIHTYLRSFPYKKVQQTIWEVVSEKRKVSIATIKNDKVVYPKEVAEVFDRFGAVLPIELLD